MMHPGAFMLCLLLRLQPQPMECAIHEALEEYTSDWTDEYKADLYARLAEKLSPDQTHEQMTDIISKAMYQADKAVFNG